MHPNRPYQICTRCVLDTSDEDFVFDALGQCNHCTGFLAEWNRVGYKEGHSEAAWQQLAAQIKQTRTHAGYDCLMGVSGGADSSYAVWLAVQSGLRPLLYHIDNGWNTELSRQNIQNLVDRLGLELVTVKLNPEAFRQVQLAFLKSSIVDIEIPTELAICAAGYQIASRHGLRHIISGGNLVSEGILPLSWGYHVTRDLKPYRHIAGPGASESLKKLPQIGLWEEAYHKLLRRVKTSYILNYFPSEASATRRLLQAELGWQDYGGKHHESTITAFWQGYVMPQKYAMDYRRATCSSKICAGQISREEALRLLQTLPYDPAVIDEQKQQVALFFGISLAQLEDYLRQPPKTYKDFPNGSRYIQQAFAAYKKIVRPLL